jgi:hypothetical protein
LLFQRHLPRLLDRVVHKLVAAGVELSPPLLLHGLGDQVEGEEDLVTVPSGLQRLAIVIDELEGKLDRWLAHGVLASRTKIRT